MRLLKLTFGCFLTSIGVLLLEQLEIVSGGTAGLALSLSLILNMPFYLLFFLINIPFYIFSVIRMGWRFTLSTIIAVMMLSLMSFLGTWIPVIDVLPIVGTFIGSTLIGIGLAVLFINGSSLGGANILALYLNKKFDFDPGKVNFMFDFLVVVSGFYYLGFLNKNLFLFNYRYLLNNY
ncbi:MAG TPA: YitT family protein [Metabacillus sp.]|nr:YitT family protein [Metabacillus sp.]